MNNTAIGGTTMALSEEAYQRKINRNKQYNTDRTFPITIRCNKSTDADILAYLSTLANKQGFLKQLIRSQMETEGFVYEPDDTDI